MEGQRFERRAVVAGAELRLNGTGVRAVAWFKGYAAGLYLPEPATTAEQAVATRRSLLARAAAERLLVFGPHLPPFGVGRVVPAPAGDGWRWQPAAWKYPRSAGAGL